MFIGLPVCIGGLGCGCCDCEVKWCIGLPPFPYGFTFIEWLFIWAFCC